MKENDKLVATLNSLLADELTAINQYIVHAEMCADWGYGKLHDHFEQRAIHEMKHAEIKNIDIKHGRSRYSFDLKPQLK